VEFLALANHRTTFRAEISEVGGTRELELETHRSGRDTPMATAGSKMPRKRA
jgi:hypothetical protein